MTILAIIIATKYTTAATTNHSNDNDIFDNEIMII